MRRGSVSLTDGQLGAIKGGESIARGVDALAWYLDEGKAKVESDKRGGVVVPGYLKSLKQFLTSQNKKASRADCLYKMGMELKEQKYYQYESLYLLERAHAHGKVEAEREVRDQLQKMLNGSAEDERKALEWCGNVPQDSVFYPLAQSKGYRQIRQLLGDNYKTYYSFTKNVCRALADNQFPKNTKITLYELKLDFSSYFVRGEWLVIPEGIIFHNCELRAGAVRFRHGVLKVTGEKALAYADGDQALVYRAAEKTGSCAGNVIGYNDYQQIKEDLSVFLDQLADKNTRANAAFRMAQRFAGTFHQADWNGGYELCAFLCKQAQALGHADAMRFLAQATYQAAQSRPMKGWSRGVQTFYEDKALTWYEGAHALGCPKAMYSLAQRLMGLGRYQEAKACYDKVASSSEMHEEAQKMLAGYQQQKHVLTGWRLEETDYYSCMPKQVVLRGCLQELGDTCPSFYRRADFYQGDLRVVDIVDNKIEDSFEPDAKRAAILIRSILKEPNKLQLMQAPPSPRIISVEDYKKMVQFGELYDLKSPLAKRAEAAYIIGCSYKERNGPLKQSDTLTEYFLDLALEWGHPDAAFTLGEWHLKKAFSNDDTVRGYLEKVPQESQYYVRAQKWLEREPASLNLAQGFGWIKDVLTTSPLAIQTKDGSISSEEEGL